MPVSFLRVSFPVSPVVSAVRRLIRGPLAVFLLTSDKLGKKNVDSGRVKLVGRRTMESEEGEHAEYFYIQEYP